MRSISGSCLSLIHIFRELLPRIGRVKLVQCNFSQYSSRYDAFCAGETPVSFDPECAGGALMDLNVYNISYIVGPVSYTHLLLSCQS